MKNYHRFLCVSIGQILDKSKGMTGLSIFFKSTSTSLFTGGTFYQNLNNFHEYLIQHSLKSRGTKDHFRQVKVPGTAPY